MFLHGKYTLDAMECITLHLCTHTHTHYCVRWRKREDMHANNLMVWNFGFMYEHLCSWLFCFTWLGWCVFFRVVFSVWATTQKRATIIIVEYQLFIFAKTKVDDASVLFGLCTGSAKNCSAATRDVWNVHLNNSNFPQQHYYIVELSGSPAIQNRTCVYCETNWCSSCS